MAKNGLSTIGNLGKKIVYMFRHLGEDTLFLVKFNRNSRVSIRERQSNFTIVLLFC